MRLLLDTHTLIWWATLSENLSQTALELIENSQNVLFLSVASVWEMQIKCQSGKPELGKPLAQLIANQQANNSLRILPVDLSHIYALQNLPNIHRDPFDRIMIAQATVENLPFVSVDALFDGYPVQRIW
jgi:PIN domain nuclease of toxin-antitoxin system